MYRRSLLFLICIASNTGAPAQPGGFPTDASQGLSELATLCALEGGRIWKRSLCGPTIIVDPATRRYVAQDTRGGSVATGMMTADVPLANTSIEWNGAHWAMILWPLPMDRAKRARLMLHESWHRLQPELGITNADAPRDHLDTVHGRVSMRLELRALGAALAATNNASMKVAACRALAIRSQRYREFPEAQKGEAALERNEGLAEYTAWSAASPVDKAELSKLVSGHDGDRAFGRSFAYSTGPAYGILLDHFRPNWRVRLQQVSDLGSILLPAMGPRCATPSRYVEAARALGVGPVRGDEQANASKRAERAAAWRARLVDGPHVSFPMANAHIVFDPNAVVALPPAGNVYPAAEITAPWGRLSVSDGALLAGDWARVTVSGKDILSQSGSARGDGWHLTLATGWEFKPNAQGQWAVEVIVTPEMRSARQ